MRQAHLHHVEAGRADFELNLMPGDDLICGDEATLDVRYATQPILDLAGFAAATPVVAIANGPAGRQAVQVRVEDEGFAGRQLHFALRAEDDAGNRSPLTVLGAVTFPAAATPTASTTPTSAPTLTPTQTATPPPTATLTPSSTSTAIPSATPTAIEDSSSGDGCTLPRRGSPAGGGWSVVLLGVAIAAARRRRNGSA